MEYVIVVLLAYLFGSLNPSILIGKLLFNINIKEVNSKNAGASNTTMTFGLKWGVLVFFLDLFKGLIPVLITRFIFEGDDIIWVTAGIGALLGHVYPIYFKFQGGKGTSTYLGVMFGLFPLVGLILLLVIIGMTLLSDYVAIGTVFMLLPPPIYMYLIGYHWISILLISLFILLSLFLHRNNFVAIYKKEEKGLRKTLWNK